MLIADRFHKKAYEDALKRHALPSGVKWGSLEDRSLRSVIVESVARFKGLESKILVLWGLDQLPDEDYRATLYVGPSRAKSILALCGRAETCEAILINESRS